MAGFENMDFAGAAINAFNAGRTYTRQRGVENALAKYGTDPAASENELMKYGAFNEAGVVRERRMQDEAVARRQGYAQQVQGGGVGAYDTAMHDALVNGDMDMAEAYGKLGNQQREMVAKSVSMASQVGARLKELYPGNSPEIIAQRKAQLERLAPDISEMTGVPIDRIMQSDVSDQGIDMMHTQAQALGVLPKPIAVSPGTHLIDPTTNRPIYEAPMRAPTGYEYDPQGNLVAIDGGPADPAVAARLAASRRKPSTGGGGAKVKIGSKAIPLGPQLDPNEWE